MADTIAGRYTLIDPIARGGSGAVWRAWDLRLRQLCAAKVLRQRDSADLLRFAREQSVKLEHPHVLAPYGWAAEDEHVVIAMPLVHGGTLESALLDNGAASADLAGEVLAQLLQALQYVHAQGWVHRDVKPGNLMLESTGTGRPHIFLSDFGIAVRVQDARLTRTGTLVGTPGYLPPEAYGLADPDPAQDFYAAGITGLRMLDPSLEPKDVMGPADARAVAGEQGDLGEHLAALLTPEPALRRDASVAVLHDLLLGAAARRFDPALTRDGEPFEIFDVLEPLPEPWARRLASGWDGSELLGPGGSPAAGDLGGGAGGPAGAGPDRVSGADTGPHTVSSAGRGPGTGTGPDTVDVRASSGRERPEPPGREPPGTEPAGSQSAETRPAGTRPAGTEPPGTGPVDAPAGRRRPRSGGVAGLLVVLLALTALLVGYLLLGPFGTLGEGPRVTTPPAGPTTTPTGPAPSPAETPVVLEQVCEDVGGGEQECYFRVP